MKILYLEDDDLVSRCVMEILSLEKWEVDTCKDAATALEKVGSSEYYDLLLLDNDVSGAHTVESKRHLSLPGSQIKTPQMSGISILHHVRSLAHRRHIPVIIFTASHCEEEAYDAGVNLYLCKPEGLSVLVEKIKKFCRE